MFIGNSMKERLLRSIIKEELKRLTEFAPGKFGNVEIKKEIMSDDEVSRALDNALKGRHASGRPFSSQFRSSLNESAEINFDSDFGKILYEIDSRVPRMRKYDFPYLHLYQDRKISIEEFSVIKSILLFTKASVATIRNPELFNSNQARITGRDVFKDALVPTKNDYQIANKILTNLAISKNYSNVETIFRGIVIDQSVADNLRPFIEFNNWPISSFTLDESIAWGFISSKFLSDKTAVLIEINNPSHGSDITRFSFYQNENEVILGKKLLIKDVIKNNDSYKSIRIECDVIP
jgi:hypothetical protein